MGPATASAGTQGGVGVAQAGSGSVLHPFQSDALLAGILGAEVDLSQFGSTDGKAFVASIVEAVPTVSSLNRKGVAAE